MATIPLLGLLEQRPTPESALSGVEPRALTEDVSAILRTIVKPEDDDAGQSVATMASRGVTSTRTVYRVLSCSTHTVKLDLADRLCIAAGVHLSACRLVWPDGTITPYDFMPDEEVT